MSLKSLFQQHPDWPSALFVVDTLTRSGYQAFLVGGCVRDALLRNPLKDFDVATSALPDEVEKLFPKTVNVGKEFGVIAVVSGSGATIEVTTYRKELEYNHRRQPTRIEFTDLKGDASRRDFTVNALYYDPHKDSVIDPYEGAKDLNGKVLRAIGKATDRLIEDPLRILRAVRFSSRLDFKLDSDLETALVQERERLRQVSKERVFDEFSKMIRGKWKAAFALLHKLELWEMMGLSVPTEKHMAWLLNEVDLEALEVPLALALLWDELSDVKIKENLKLLKAPNEYLKEIEFMRSRSRRLPQIRKGEAFLIFAERPKGFLDYLRIKGSFQSVRKRFEEFEKISDDSGKLPAPLVSGEELMKRGVKEGPELGALKSEIYLRQLEGDFSSLDGLDDLISELRRTSSEV